MCLRRQACFAAFLYGDRDQWTTLTTLVMRASTRLAKDLLRATAERCWGHRPSERLARSTLVMPDDSTTWWRWEAGGGGRAILGALEVDVAAGQAVWSP